MARRFAALLTPLVNQPIIIEAVFDTVASIGWPNLDATQRPQTDVVFEDGHTLPSGVKKALHLVALDEQRLAFRPTLINHDGRALEIWLPGVHSDVGGGYRKDGMGDLALTLMIQWLEMELKQHCYRRAHPAVKADPKWRPLLTLQPKYLGAIHYQQRLLPVWHDLTLAPRHSCVLVKDQPSRTHVPYWHPSVMQRIHADTGYFPLARCTSEVVLWQP